MAENKGSSSNPAKGLVNHLDQNRSLQQDRFVGSSSNGPRGTVSRFLLLFLSAHFVQWESTQMPKLTSSQQSFRARPDGPAAAALDAAFTQFGTQATGMQPGGLSMRPAHTVPANPGALPFGQTANTAWANEFLHLRSQPGVGPGAVEGHVYHHMTLERLNGEQMNSGATAQTWPLQHEQPVITPAQREMPAPQGLALRFGVSPPLAHPSMFPAERLTEEIRLADNAEQAMQAAFAAYDQDFEGAMNGWMEADNAGDLEGHIQNIRMMEQMTVQDPLPTVSKSSLPTKDASNKVEEPVAKKFPYDYDMIKQANAIVGTLSTNGSEEVKAKMAGSSFTGLMRAIASGKATVVDDNFIDTSTGEVIQDLVELSGANQESDGMSNGLQIVADNTDTDTDTEGKGKGKMKSLQEQGQSQEHKDGAA